VVAQIHFLGEPFMAASPEGKEIKAGDLGEVVEVKTEGKKGSKNTKFLHVRVTLQSGEEKDLLFTEHEIKRAIDRAKKNPKDVPTQACWLDYLFG
jgi:hypothetical protein